MTKRAIIVQLMLLALLLAVPLFAEWFDQGHWVKLATRMVIFAMAALALDFALGVGGMVSFGHAAFLGLGGYVAGIAFQHDFSSTPFWGIAASQEILILAPLAMLAAGLFAAITGLISLRCQGIAFIMITLAFAQMLFYLFVSLRYYNGEDGIALWQRGTLAGSDWLEVPWLFYLLCLSLLVAAYGLFWRLTHSTFGIMLKAASHNPNRLRSLGAMPDRYRLIAFILSGAVTGLAGLLLANATYFVGPSFLSWQNSGHLIIMVVMGGMGTLIGPVFGAIAYLGLEEWLPLWLEQIVPGYGQHWRLIFGPILVLIALYARGGLARLLLGPARHDA